MADRLPSRPPRTNWGNLSKNLALWLLVGLLALALFQMTLVLIVGRLVFDVPLTGSLLLLYAVAHLFIIASLAVGMFISTLVKTQQQSMQLSFFYVLPNILLSGFMFPRQSMPVAFQWLSTVLPITHFLKVLRGILLKGVGLDALWREVGILAGFSVLLITLAVRRFHKTLD